MKDTWPPTAAKNVETITASFIPPKTGSAVRLFNLAVDVPTAALQDGSGKVLASGVKYTLGSAWAPVPSTEQTFAATVSVSVSRMGTTNSTGVPDNAVFQLEAATPLATAPFTPPSAPQVGSGFDVGGLCHPLPHTVSILDSPRIYFGDTSGILILRLKTECAAQVFTAFLMGSKAYGYSLLPQLDAPETGPCKPTDS